MGRLGDRRRRRRGGAHGGHQSHRRRQSADNDAVQHRQAARRTRQQQLPRQSRRRRERRPLEGPSAEADRRRIDARRPLVCAAGQHPRGQLALLQHQGVRRRRDSRTQDLERRAGGRPEAEGQGRHPLRSRRAGLAGPSPVRRGSRRRRRLRPLSRGLRQGPPEGDREPGLQACRRSVQAVGRPDGSRHARPQLERRDRDGDHRQGRLPGDGRLGQGRVPQRRSDPGQGIWLRDPRRRRRLCDGRGRVRLPEDEGRQWNRRAGQAAKR